MVRKLWICLPGIVLVLALTVLGCSNATPPSSADVAKAFAATIDGLVLSPAPQNQTYDPSTGIYNPPPAAGVDISYTATDPTVSPWKVNGTIVFSNWTDPATKQTINGPMSFSATITGQQGSVTAVTMTMTCDLTLTGGGVSTLKCNLVFVTLPVQNVSGTITANGFTYTVKNSGVV